MLQALLLAESVGFGYRDLSEERNLGVDVAQQRPSSRVDMIKVSMHERRAFDGPARGQWVACCTQGSQGCRVYTGL